MILKSWKLIHDQQRFSSNLLSNPKGGFVNLEAQKIWVMIINVKKNWKKMAKISNICQIRDVKILQEIPFNLAIIQ